MPNYNKGYQMPLHLLKVKNVNIQGCLKPNPLVSINFAGDGLLKARKPENLMRKFLLSLLLLLSSGMLPIVAQNADVERLFNWFKASTGFDRTYPREKVYLHLDNSAYLEGDTLWYKAYVVRASSLTPTTLSRVLYVDLLNADGQLMEKQTLRLDSLGQADGAFKLALPIRAGYYEVRAYTREMTNWGTSACFSRVVPVFTGSNPQEGITDRSNMELTGLSIPEPEANDKASLGAPRPYELAGNNDRLLTFYPEGGLRVGGTMQRVAFKLTDGKGREVSDEVDVYDADGNLVISAETEHDGMGTFILPPDFSKGYAMVRGTNLSHKAENAHFDLPEPDASTGYGLQVQMEPDGMTVVVMGGDNANETGSLLGLAVIHRESPCYFDTLTIGREAVELFIPRTALRGGVNRVELFDTQGHSQSTRLVWVGLSGHDDRHVSVDLKQNEAVYNPFSPAVLTMELKDAQGKPVQTVFSVAVRDESGNITATNDGGVAASLLLSSELRGYVRRPDLYFERDDAAHRRMIDLLLMVQGWTASTFDVMCGADTFNLQQPIEDKLILRGTLYEANNKRRPQSGFDLDMRGYSFSGGSIVGESRTDSQGKFAFESNVDFEGEYIVQFTTRNENGKRKWGRLSLDRWFAPTPRPFSAADLQLNVPLRGDSLVAFEQSAAPNTFVWKDTIPRTLPTILGEAKVTGKGKYHGFTGNRYTWKGGEKTGMEQAMKFYNIEQEVEHVKDLGMEVGDLGTLLAQLNGDIEYDISGTPTTSSTETSETVDPTATNPLSATDDAAFNGNYYDGALKYRGREIEVYRNNELLADLVKRHPEIYGELLAEEIKSVAIVFDNYATNAVTGERTRTSRSSYKMYIYDIPDFYRYRSKRGVERRRVQGFTQSIKFYAPNYRSFDLPNDADLRRTLHWEPSVKTDAEGKAHLIFFTNAREDQRLDISVRGVTATGGWVEN